MKVSERKEMTPAQIIANRRNRVLDARGYVSLIFRLIFLAAAGWILFTQVFYIGQTSGNGMFPAVKDGDLMIGYNVGDLKITKTVAGNMGDKTKYFPFTVQLTGETDKTYAGSYAVGGGSYASNPPTIAVGTTATFYLKHGETLTIADLPAGISYEIVETAANTEGYITAVTNSDGDGDVESTTEGETTTYTGKATGSIDAGDDITVAYTNTKGTTVDTGIVLDSMPYILMLAVACMGLVVVFTKKRRAE